MSIAEWNEAGKTYHPESAACGADGGPVLHRIAAVRKRQGMSMRNVARRLRIDSETARQQEQEATDLPLSMLYKWQRVLEVPVCELLIDEEASLSPPIMARARMIKLMKSATAILESCNTPSMRRMVTQLIEQLLEIMPELKDVGPWQAFGQPRTMTEYGRAAERAMPEDFSTTTDRRRVVLATIIEPISTAISTPKRWRATNSFVWGCCRILGSNARSNRCGWPWDTLSLMA